MAICVFFYDKAEVTRTIRKHCKLLGSLKQVKTLSRASGWILEKKYRHRGRDRKRLKAKTHEKSNNVKRREKEEGTWPLQYEVIGHPAASKPSCRKCKRLAVKYDLYDDAARH